MSSKLTYEELHQRVKELEQESAERKRVEKALKEKEHFLQIVFDAIQDGISVRDVDLTVTLVNRWMERQYESEMPLVGKKCYTVFQKRNSPCPWCPAILAMESGKMMSETVPYPSEDDPIGWLELTAFPIRAIDGEIIGCIEHIKNITERKRAEEAMRHSEVKYRDLYDDAPDMFVSVDSKTANIIECNQTLAKTLGYKKEEIIGRPVFDLYAPDSAKRARDILFPLFIKTGSIQREELQIQRKDGSTIEVSLNASAVRNDQGDIVYSRSIWRDITERKLAEEVVKLNELRLEALVELNQMTDASLEKIAAFAMEEAVRLTQSKIGYVAFASEDESILTMHAWSKHALQQCGTSEKPIIYPVKDTGLWGEAVRQRRPVITNDYQAPNPFKRGVPEGHVQVTRHMNVPIFDGDRIVIVAGVGNKEVAYDDSDVRQLTLLMSGMWRIVQRKHMEEALRESEERYRVFFEQGPDGVVVLDPETARIIEFNDQACRQLGYSREEFALLRVPDIEAKETAKETKARIQKVLSEGHDDFETIQYTKQGEIRHVHVTAQMIEIAGRPVYHCIWRDITERKRAEQDQKKLQAQLSNALEMANLGPWEYDIASDEFTFNDYFYKIFRTTAEKVGGYKMSSTEYAQRFVHPDDISMVGAEIQKVIETADPNYRRQLEHRILYADGSAGYITVRFFIVKDAYGKIIKTFGVNQDITERKEAEKEKKKLEDRLIQAQKMESIGTLAGGIAHDFNNILFPMMGFAEMSLDDVPKNSLLYNNIKEIFLGTKRAADLINQILAFSRQSDQKPKPLKVQIVIKEVLKLIRASIPTTIEIKHDISKDCGLVMADATQIHQVAMNMMTNAYQAMEDEGGVLKLTLQEVELMSDDLTDPSMSPGTYACLTVADTGPGMDQSVIDRIFEPYFTTKENGKGTGLGLAVVHGIVKSYRGDIKVYSKPGKGSTFHVYLPVIKSRVETEATEAAEPVPKGTERILFVDDEETIVRLQKQVLERLGYDVTERTSSIEALEAFRTAPNKFDLVISDMTMPKMNGVQFAQKLLEIRPDIPIIICTGFSTIIDDEKAKEYGIRGFVMKPMVQSELAKKIREVLDKD